MADTTAHRKHPHGRYRPWGWWGKYPGRAGRRVV